MDHVAIAAVIVVVMFVSMRLLYGYWPWRTHPRLRRRAQVADDPPPGSFDFQPIPGTVGVIGNDNKDSFERPQPTAGGDIGS
jgi:hypothetical protein